MDGRAVDKTELATSEARLAYDPSPSTVYIAFLAAEKATFNLWGKTETNLIHYGHLEASKASVDSCPVLD